MLEWYRVLNARSSSLLLFLSETVWYYGMTLDLGVLGSVLSKAIDTEFHLP